MNVHTYTHARTCISFHVNQALATRRGTNPICASCGPLHLSHVPFVTSELRFSPSFARSENREIRIFRSVVVSMLIHHLSLSLSLSLSLLLVSFVRPLFWGRDSPIGGSHVLKSDSFGICAAAFPPHVLKSDSFVGATYKPCMIQPIMEVELLLQHHYNGPRTRHKILSWEGPRCFYPRDGDACSNCGSRVAPQKMECARQPS